MTLDEAIKHAEEVAEEQEENVREGRLQEQDKYADDCERCAKEHRQLAEWLKDYKRLLDQQSGEPHKGNIYLSREAYGDLCFAASKWNELEICGGNSKYVRRGKTGDWIPVSERLPKPRVDVWVNSDIGQMQGYYEEYTGVWYASSGQGRDYLELIVNAWMPLPQPPEEVENG